MTSEIFGVFGVKLRIECFKSCIAPELSDFTLIEKLIIIVIELYALSFQLVHTRKADTVILVAAGELINLKFALSLFHIINGADRIFFLEIVKYLLFLSRQLRVCFKERNENVKHSVRSFLIFRLIERVLCIAEDTLIVSANMVDQRPAARAFAVTNVKATVIIELLTANNGSNAEICLFIPTCFQLRNISLRVLFLVKVFEDSIAKGKTAIGVCKGKIVNDVTFAYPFIALILAEIEGQAIRLLFGLFSFKGHIVLVLCDTSKRFLCLVLITENIKQSLFDTVELRDIIAVLPPVECGTVKCRDKLLYRIIGNIGNIVLDKIKHRPICQVLIFLMDTVYERLSDLLKGNETLHTAETALVTVLSPLRMQRVTEIFSIIICAV